MKKKISILLCMLFYVISILTGCAGTLENETVVEDTTEQPTEYSSEIENVTLEPDIYENQSYLTDDSTFSVTFLNVGQGNAVLVESNGSYMLIDGGDRNYSSFVVSYLKQAGVNALTYVVVSHYDADHLNGVVGALNVFPCTQVLSPDYKTDSRVFDSFENILAQNAIPETHPNVGDTFSFGSAEFTIVCPETYGASDDNANSIGVRIQYGNTSFLICGDAPISSEKQMLASGEVLNSDVYMASHHGSDTASSKEFLTAVSPEYVVISSGLSNSYGHPAKSTMDRIKEVGANILRTDLQGTLVATSDGNTISWNVPPCNDYRSGDEIEGVSVEESHSDAEVSDPGTESNYVVNTNTKKFHKPDCSSVSDMKENNTQYVSKSREALIDEGYEPCKRCNP